MAKDKKSFIAYCDWIGIFEKLADDEAGRLSKHLFRYVNDLNPITDERLIDIIFEPIKQQLKRDLVKWDGIKIIRSESGRLGGIKSGEIRKQKQANEASASKSKQKQANEASASKSKQKQANEAVTVTVNDTVIDKKDIADKSAYVQCMEIYNHFIRKQTDCDAIIDGLQGKSLNSIIDYFNKNIKVQPATEGSKVKAVKYIFDNYEKWSDFHKKGLKLNQISSELVNIIHDIRSFKSKPVNKD